MSQMGKAWMVAATVGAVEALKDQGFCRWNYTSRSIHQHAKNSLRSFLESKKLPSSSSAMVSRRLRREGQAVGGVSEDCHVLELLGTQLRKQDNTKIQFLGNFR